MRIDIPGRTRRHQGEIRRPQEIGRSKPTSLLASEVQELSSSPSSVRKRGCEECPLRGAKVSIKWPLITVAIFLLFHRQTLFSQRQAAWPLPWATSSHTDCPGTARCNKSLVLTELRFDGFRTMAGPGRRRLEDAYSPNFTVHDLTALVFRQRQGYS